MAAREPYPTHGVSDRCDGRALADDPIVEALLHVEQLVGLTL